MLAKYFSFHTTNIQKYIDFYRQYAITLDAFLTALDTVAQGVLSTPIIDPGYFTDIYSNHRRQAHC